MLLLSIKRTKSNQKMKHKKGCINFHSIKFCKYYKMLNKSAVILHSSRYKYEKALIMNKKTSI